MNKKKIFFVIAVVLSCVAWATSYEKVDVAGDDPIVLKKGDRLFVKTPSGLELSLISEGENDTLSVSHPNRPSVTFSSTKEKVTSLQVIQSKGKEEVFHLDRNGDGIPELQLITENLQKVVLKKITLLFENL